MNDRNDFISPKYSHKFKGVISNIFFNGFPYFLIAYMMILAATFHGKGKSDLISTVYLFLAFYYIVNFRKLYTKNSNLISYLRKYNLIVLFSILIFEIPVFICPAILDP